jgi:hypothetical protein
MIKLLAYKGALCVEMILSMEQKSINRIAPVVVTRKGEMIRYSFRVTNQNHNHLCDGALVSGITTTY